MVVPNEANGLQRGVARMVFLLEWALVRTLRWEFRDNSGCFASAEIQPVIFGVWHNRLALSMAIYRQYPRRRQPGRRLAALVSASKDGALLARILENFGVEPVRGSSSRRGPQALLELTGWAGRGYDLAITPDGPRGPRYRVQEGIIALAQLTGLPILPVVPHVSRKFELRSWDRFQVPWPLARCAVEFKPPLLVPREATEAQREACRRNLEQLMEQERASG